MSQVFDICLNLKSTSSIGYGIESVRQLRGYLCRNQIAV